MKSKPLLEALLSLGLFLALIGSLVYLFEFKLYDAATSGTLIGTATQDDVAVIDGLPVWRWTLAAGPSRVRRAGWRWGCGQGAVPAPTRPSPHAKR